MVMKESPTITVDDEAELTPWQVVSVVSKDIAETYGSIEIEKVRPQLDAFMLATARVFQFQSKNSPYPSEQEKSALKAVNRALLGDWEPMRAFLQIEVDGEKTLRELNDGELADDKLPIENLLASI